MKEYSIAALKRQRNTLFLAVYNVGKNRYELNLESVYCRILPPAAEDLPEARSYYRLSCPEDKIKAIAS